MFGFFQQIIIFGLCSVLALFIGLTLTDPGSTNILLISLLVLLLTFPLVLRWHYALLIAAWNASIVVFFLPGQPLLVFLMAAVSLGLTVATRPLSKSSRPPQVRSVAYSLFFIGVVVAVTAALTGGIGASSLGSDYSGGKRYLGVFGPVLGYFALTSKSIPKQRAQLYGLVFFLSGLTAAMSDLVYAAGPKFYTLFNFFPVNLAVTQALSDDSLVRLSGVAFAALSGTYFFFLRYGILGIFDWKKPWRLFLLLILIGVSLLGGFRSVLVIVGLIFGVQCFFERGVGMRVFLSLILCGLIGGSALVLFAHRLPLSVQRSLSFLPIPNLDPSAKIDAQSTLDWRFDMWKAVVLEIPRYLFLGKGFMYDAMDYSLIQEAKWRGIPYSSYEETLISGNYHNGFLTIIIPFGIWGVIGFVWFCWAGIRVLYQNFRYSAPNLRPLNTFLLSFFVGRLLYFLIFYGQFDLDLIVFVGVVGFSIALNGKSQPTSPVQTERIEVDAFNRKSALRAV